MNHQLRDLLEELTQPDALPFTSGSSGQPRRCLHTPQSLLTAAEGFAARFPQIRNAVNVLPANHVSGQMPRLRVAVAGGRVVDANYRDPASWIAAPFALEHSSLSLVPTQLSRLLLDPQAVDALRRFGLILLGGAPAGSDLLAAARAHKLQLAPCYGMSETAAMVTALDPQDFLAGHSGVGTALPHARLFTEQGILFIDSPAVCHGYIPEDPGFTRSPFRTHDLAEQDAAGRWLIHGRADRALISGGEKIHPEAVEAAAAAFPGVAAARCFGLSDPDWGSRVCLEVVAEADAPADLAARIDAHLRDQLPAFAIPKQITIVPAADISALGKWRKQS